METLNTLVLMSGTTKPGSSPRHLLNRREPAAPPSPPSFDGVPLLTVDDLLWFLYLYPLRVLSAFVPQGFVYSIGRLFQFRARKRRDMATRRMLATQCAGIARDQVPQIADK